MAASRRLSILSAGFLALLLSSCSLLGTKTVTMSLVTSKYVVIGDNGVIKMSDDGHIWTNDSSSVSNLWNSLNIANPHFAYENNKTLSPLKPQNKLTVLSANHFLQIPILVLYISKRCLNRSN